MNRLKVIY